MTTCEQEWCNCCGMLLICDSCIEYDCDSEAMRKEEE